MPKGEERLMFWKKIVTLVIAAMLLVACSGQSGGETVEVQVTLTEFGFDASLTDFKVGVPYRFVVTNAGTVNHEIMIMAPLTEEDTGMDMHELDETALAMIEEDQLPSGATASFEYTFMEAADTGSLEFACHTPGHYEAGMKLPITVSP
jgi:uncharacterized cupredoxin-like copper-binding protein